MFVSVCVCVRARTCVCGSHSCVCGLHSSASEYASLTATDCNTLNHTATHRNTLQRPSMRHLQGGEDS